MIFLVLLLAVAAGGTAYYFYCRSDEGLRQMVLRQLEATAPTLKFELARAQWDMIGRVHLHGLTIRLPEDDEEKPSIEIPKVEATLESRPLTDFENVVIQKLRIINPRVRAIRSSAGEWNFSGLALTSTSSGAPPEVEIEYGTVSVEVQLPRRPARRLKFQNVNVTAVPTDSRRLAIQVAALLEPAGPLSMDLRINLDGPKWECVSREPWRIPVDSKLLQLLSDLSPEAAVQFAKVAKWIEVARGMQSTGATSIPDESLLGDPAPTEGIVPDFGLRCVCDVTFQISHNNTSTRPEFRALFAISEGQLTNDLLPLPLHELRGNILVDSRQIIASDFHASSGSMQFAFDGEIVPSKPIQGTMKLRGIELTDDLKSRLPESLRKVLLPLGLTGICNADLSVTHDSGKWQPKIDLTLTRGTVKDIRFPVAVHNVQGELHILNDVVTFHGTGKYANQPVAVEGTVRNPGPGHQAEIVIKSHNLPLDDESIEASPAPVQRTIKALNLSCRHDLLLRITRPAGIGQKYKLELADKIHDGRISFQGFRYEVQKFQGFLKWSGDDVTFSNLSGTHDGTELTGYGTFRRQPGPGVLELFIDATDGAFDRSLKEALPEKLKLVWNDFQPKGNFDIKTQIHWIPGQPCDIEIPSMMVRHGEVLMRTFSWPLQNLHGEFTYSTRTARLEMKEMHAEHDETQLSGSGFGSFPNGAPWRLKFNQLNVDNLTPNSTLRNALPAGVQRVYDILQPKGDFSFYGPVEFLGPQEGEETISASWNLKTVLSGCEIHAGTSIDHVRGVVQLEGTWDGHQADLNGELNLDSISVFGKGNSQSYEITSVRGPISFHESKFIAGTSSAIPPRKNTPDPAQRISGKAIGGTVYLDAVVDVESETGYQVFVELEKGFLERYAQQYLRGRSNLAGVMNGWIHLYGKGAGSEQMQGVGKLRIAPAALYELPLFVQMFSLPQLRVPDKTAFEQADLNFTVADERFDFKSIELLGDAMSLRGRGYVRFDGGMELEFGSRPGRGRRRMFQNLFMGAEWIAVRVTGNVGNPRVAYIPLPDLDDAMRQFFNPRQMMPPSGRLVPRTGQNSSPGEQSSPK